MASVGSGSPSPMRQLMTRPEPSWNWNEGQSWQSYHNVPVHPDDRPLLGMMWNQEVFVDATLPFGLRSAPKIFTALEDWLEWILYHEGACKIIHYIDDFLAVNGVRECTGSG